MKPYTPATNKGRALAVAGIHHKTANQGRAAAKATAKVQRHAARQDARRQVEIASGGLEGVGLRRVEALTREVAEALATIPLRGFSALRV